MIKVSVLGATGYGGIELVRLLTSHPNVDIYKLVSHSYAGKSLADVYPNFTAYKDISLSSLDIEEIANGSDIVFTSLPHGTSSEIIPLLYEKGVRIIDLSGDFRYISPEVFEKWYGYKHPHPQLLGESVYGLPELYKEDIKKARLVGNPGCYPTGAILTLAPLIANKLIDLTSIIIDAKSGATGAGRATSVDLNFCEVDENIKAYKVATHRHTSEIEQEISLLAGKDITLSFTPHLLPIKRGILSTIYATLLNTLSFDDIYALYKEFYKGASFVSIYTEGKFPEVKYVNGSNQCHIGFAIDKRTNRIILVSAIDNLVKGAGGQAIQNMNIMFGLDETTGLPQLGWYL
ncbi:MAG: N-acetyl-gamma-glutamyl-phosphate reductase [Clostridiales bacterium]|nr:N-acetyl-gamma-glutamyl-phosphate reductase [Clostridiales bacterium]